MNKNVLIIGGSSFLGQALTNVFVEAGAFPGLTFSSKATFDSFMGKPKPGVRGHLLDLVKVCQQDLNDLVANFDVIVNCTGQVSKPITACFDLNSKGVQKLVTAVKTLNKKLVHISTVGVYGSGDFKNELSPVSPETPYSTCKSFAEYLVAGLPESQYCIIRLSNLYGDGQKKGLVSYLIRSAVADRKLMFDNNGDMTRYYLEVTDCAVILAKMIDARCQGIFNCIGAEQYTINQLVALFGDILGVQYDAVYQDMPPYDNALEISDDKLRQFIEPAYQHTLRSFAERQSAEIHTSN